MPTDEWFKENPKISGYISSDLFQRFNDWMKERGIKKVSQGLTRILEEHLGVIQSEPIQSTTGDDRLESLEAKFVALSQEFAAMKTAIALPQPQTESKSEVDQSSNSQLSFLEDPREEVDQTRLIKEEEQALENLNEEVDQIEPIREEEQAQAQVEQSRLSEPGFWTTKQLEEVGVSRTSLKRWKDSDQLPKDSKGFRIVRWAGKQTKKPFGDLWEVNRLPLAPES